MSKSEIYMGHQELRDLFLGFFKDKGHEVFPSDSLIPSSDPTLLFTSAGMVQFKDYFSGKLTGLKRVCSCQKCFRTTDIDKIGYTSRHLSFFEMLGNFSFGDYFKEEAIQWGWEFLVDTLKISPEKLYATVYQEDDEAYNIWRKILPEEKIVRLGMEDNFWMMGETGPCGPCSELIYDRGERYGCGKISCKPGCDCDRWLEVWNLVFTQYNRKENGELERLPVKNIDTGMGLERLLMVVNGCESVFDTDLFEPIASEFKRMFDVKESNQVYLRIILDCVRAVTFLICDGVVPSNVGRGYLLRRMIRRTLRFSKLMGINEPFIYMLTDVVVELMKEVYPELAVKASYISSVSKSEEDVFLRTLERGIELLNEIILDAKTKNVKNVSAEKVYRLYDTYGFPTELTKEILQEEGLTYDEDEYRSYVAKAVEISKAAWKTKPLTYSVPFHKASSFIDHVQLATVVDSLFIEGNEVEKVRKGERASLLLPVTPFYGESGGQVGDTGWIFDLNNNLLATVIDTKKAKENLIIHEIIAESDLETKQPIIAKIDLERRERIKRHHTATHLLHRALRITLGDHARQHGSLVAPDRLRFDFFHQSALSEEELVEIENNVNKKIMESQPVITFNTTLKEALDIGAVALFGEKYSEQVRCVMIGGDRTSPKEAFSIELCGGTHVKNTSEIGVFKIISEMSIASSVRRIEAIAGLAVLDYLREKEKLIEDVKEVLRSSEAEILQKIELMISQVKSLEKEAKRLKEKTLLGEKIRMEKIKDVTLIIQELQDVDVETLRALSDKYKFSHREKAAVFVSSVTDDKVSFVFTFTKDLVPKLNAVEIARKVAEKIYGSAGGRIDFAQGGGRGKDLSECIEVLINNLNLSL